MLSLTTLPRRNDDDLTGEVRLRIYQSCLTFVAREQLDWMVQQTVMTCKWFPTIKELIDLADKWVRDDRPAKVKRTAQTLYRRELQIRDRDKWKNRAEVKPLTQADVDGWAPPFRDSLISMGLRCGAVIEVDGKILISPEEQERAA